MDEVKKDKSILDEFSLPSLADISMSELRSRLEVLGVVL